MGRKLVAAMKDKLGKQLFEVVIQASANGSIVARETIKVSMMQSQAASTCRSLEFRRHKLEFCLSCQFLAVCSEWPW